MSASITSQFVDSGRFFHSSLDPKGKEKLTPWVFEHTDFADLECVERWPEESMRFREMFHHFNSYIAEANLSDTSLPEPDFLAACSPESQCRDSEEIEPGLLEDIVGRVETVSLPRRSWKYSNREYCVGLTILQSLVLRKLIETIYLKLDLRALEPRLHFPVSSYKQVYFLAGKKYTSKPEFSAMVRLQDQYFPVLSFTSWFPEQTWGEFLGEILATMLGQLACNIQFGLRDQEMFTLGFYKRQVFIARGFFTKDQISRVRSNGCSVDESFNITFTRGYDLAKREDWYALIEELGGLLRYFTSENAAVGGLQAFFSSK